MPTQARRPGTVLAHLRQRAPYAGSGAPTSSNGCGSSAPTTHNGSSSPTPANRPARARQPASSPASPTQARRNGSGSPTPTTHARIGSPTPTNALCRLGSAHESERLRLIRASESAGPRPGNVLAHLRQRTRCTGAGTPTTQYGSGSSTPTSALCRFGGTYEFQRLWLICANDPERKWIVWAGECPGPRGLSVVERGLEGYADHDWLGL
jgi:hypothetical protein